jgi:hypothetical protein
VRALIHREDQEFPGLAECQAKARELQGALAAPSGDLAQQASALESRLRPFVALITLVDGWNRLDDDRCASLQDVISQTFGRPLGLAALRGKLGHEGEMRAAPEPPRPAPIAAEPVAPPTRLFTAAASQPLAAPAPVVAAPSVVAPPPMVAPPPVVAPPAPPPRPPLVAPPPVVAEPVVEPPRRPPRPILPPSLDEPWANSPVPDGPAEVEIRLNSEQVHVETPSERREREALLERLAAKNAQWWIRARTAYKALAARDVSPANAARETLGKFPYLLAVPLQRSVDFAGGRLAEGYAILLQRIDKEEAGFVDSALTRLNPQFTTGGKTDSYPLGQELYLYVVAQGRLYKTYPEFLKDVLGHVLPEPGVWLQGAITEGDDETHVVTNGSTPGSGTDDTRRVTSARDRSAEHTFNVTTGPLTSRIFTVQADTLKQPADVEIKLKENDSASDKAWVIQAAAGGKPDAKRLRAGGTTVESLGKDVGSVVIAVFNSDPNTDKLYELSITLKRKTANPLAAKPDASKQRPSPFAPRRP